VRSVALHFDEVFFLEVAHVHRAHEDAMRYGLPGEDPGVLDIGLIESAVMAPRNSYPQSLAEIAAQYAIGIAHNHGYQNANKRAAVFAMALFLEMNGYPADPLWRQWSRVMVSVVTGKCSRSQLQALIVTQFLGGVDVEINP